MNSYPCPCCGYLVFDEPPGSYDICPVCGWEDDVSQLRLPTVSGANRPLIECQREFLASPRATGLPSQTKRGVFRRESGWRPINTESDYIEVSVPGVDSGTTYPDDLTTLYYWRRPHD